jgi:CRISPR/Cas system CSM-associated protein Csm5 (group 7 of RAMP superfamily)
MPLDKNTIPPVVIKEGKYGDVEITKERSVYFLKHSKTNWNQYNEKNMREYHEQWSGYDLAYGNVLISGFGFGQFATWIASKPEVTSVTCLEISQDILDAFLANNTMPDNIEVIIGNAYEYKTDKHYDCIILDHIPDGPQPESLYQDLATISKNVPNHSVFWFWSLELHYIKDFYDITVRQMYVNPIDFASYNFYSNWKKFTDILNVPALPVLNKLILSQYIDSFFLRHLMR